MFDEECEEPTILERLRERQKKLDKKQESKVYPVKRIESTGEIDREAILRKFNKNPRGAVDRHDFDFDETNKDVKSRIIATYEHDIKDTSILDKLYQKKESIATQEDTLFLCGVQNCFDELNLAGKSASLYVNSRFEAR